MPLIKCLDCGKEISDMAPSCPHCGRPLNIAKTNSIQVITPRDTRINFEAVGGLMMLASFGGCCAGCLNTATSGRGGGVLMGISAIIALVGLGIFIIGRFQK